MSYFNRNSSGNVAEKTASFAIGLGSKGMEGRSTGLEILHKTLAFNFLKHFPFTTYKRIYSLQKF